jgi:KTSC domain
VVPVANLRDYYKILRGQGYSPRHAREQASLWKRRESLPAPSQVSDAVPDPVITDDLKFISWRDPSPTINPARPRSDRIRYDSVHQVVAIDWARPSKNPEIGPTTYYRNVPRQVWEQLANHEPSTGRYVNRVLNGYPYDYNEGV